MSTSFRLLRKYLGPSWLTREEDSELVGYSLDIVKDAFVRRLELGHFARLPQQEPTGQIVAPSDALAAMGRDRRVVRGINESAQTYALRLRRWLDDRRTCGSAYALMKKLAEYCGPLPAFRTVDARGNWYHRAADGTESYLLDQGNWNWDNRPTDAGGNLRWSRFWIIIYPNGLWLPYPNDWGDTSGQDWGASSNTWGSTATHDQIDTIRGIVSDWKPAGTRCVKIILAFDGASFAPTAPEPDGTWEFHSKNIAGVQVPARLSTARYLDGP